MQEIMQQVRAISAGQPASLPDVVPAATRSRTGDTPTSTLVPIAPGPHAHQTAPAVQPFSFTAPAGAPSYPMPSPMPGSPAATTGVPPAPAPTNINGLPVAPPAHQARNRPVDGGVQVLFGPMSWDKDITGQFRTLMQRTPNGHLIAPDSVRAQRLQSNRQYIIVTFNRAADAITFINNWSAAPPAGYEVATASLMQGN
ncbi:hypothetical protein BJ912DRAFT_999733 [Pholiota molesta]|nr:hypothetical protein BJ912DRAFT_999733 [Pholiota molesta]